MEEHPSSQAASSVEVWAITRVFFNSLEIGISKKYKIMFMSISSFVKCAKVLEVR